jgi:hypothetical protein
MLPQYVETILQSKDLEEHVFVIEIMYQTMMENKIKHNIPPNDGG